MTISDIKHTLSVETDLKYGNYIDCHFLRLAYLGELMTIVGGGWITDTSIDCAPGELLGGADYHYNGSRERLISVDGALCHLILNGQSLVIRAAAKSAADARAAIAAVGAIMPEAQSATGEVPVRFWWWDVNRGPMNVVRPVAFAPWVELQHNYSHETRERLAGLSGWTEHPQGGGRLILWHGDPGTGKTHGLRTLAGEWRSWADFEIVADPEQFLGNSSYLLSVTAGNERRRPDAPDRWKVVVLEDAGEFLLPDAKRATGQALSRLLNICDGLLGQAMRVLVLITTNEPAGQLHPALTRPGRCISEIAFEPLGPAEIREWCEREEAAPPEVQRASLAELYAHVNGHGPNPNRRRAAMGFAPVAA